MNPSTASIADKQRTERTLPELMATLPQELYDQIYDEVITTYPRAVVLTRSNRSRYVRPPKNLLKVSREFREQLLDSYFANTTFIVRHNDHVAARTFSKPARKRRVQRIMAFSCYCHTLKNCSAKGCVYRMRGGGGVGRDPDPWAAQSPGVVKKYCFAKQVREALEKEGTKVV